MTQQGDDLSQVEDQYSQAYAARDIRTGAPVTFSGGAAPAAASAAPQKGKGKAAGIIVGICVVVILALGALSCSATMDELESAFTGGSSDMSAAVPSIAVIDINSTIDYDGSACSPSGLKSRLEAAQEDPLVEGVILRVNSGGGVATAGEEMSHLVAQFAKPIVVVSEATNASAAYEISSQADYIFCAKTTSIGSIGVILQVTDLSGLYEKLGINIDNITSAESKDAGASNRPLTEEERAWYQAMVDEIDADFVQTVADGRGMPLGKVRELANGLPYTGQQAVENGLADEIGYFEDALLYLSQAVGYEGSLPTINYEVSESSLGQLLDLLSAGQSSSSTSDIKAEGMSLPTVE